MFGVVWCCGGCLFWRRWTGTQVVLTNCLVAIAVYQVVGHGGNLEFMLFEN
jgi:hypothetical protein